MPAARIELSCLAEPAHVGVHGVEVERPAAPEAALVAVEFAALGGEADGRGVAADAGGGLGSCQPDGHLPGIDQTGKGADRRMRCATCRQAVTAGNAASAAAEERRAVNWKRQATLLSRCGKVDVRAGSPAESSCPHPIGPLQGSDPRRLTDSRVSRCRRARAIVTTAYSSTTPAARCDAP